MTATTPPWKLTDLVDREVLQGMQDGFAALGQVSVVIHDERGEAVTWPTCASPVCDLVGATSRLAGADRKQGLAAAQGGERADAEANRRRPCRCCHAGIGSVCVPIECQGFTLGTLAVGDRPTEPVDRTQLGDLARACGLDEDKLDEAMAKSATWTPEQRLATVRGAEQLAKTIAQLCEQDLLLRERIEDLTAVFNIADMLAGTADLKAALKDTAKTISEVMRVKACAIRLLKVDTGELVMTAVHNLSEAYLNKGPVILGQNPIDDAAFEGEMVHITDAATDPRTRYPAEARREGIVSGLCSAMSYRGERVGVIRVYTDKPHRFSRLEESLLRAIGSHAAAAIITAQLIGQRQESERYHRQLRYAGEIQRRMIPAEPPRHGNITFGGVYAPSLEVGGDFYDFIPLPGGSLGMCVADVVGKGMPAALMMASVRSALRGHAHSVPEVHEVIEQVNRHMCRDTLVHEFATLFYGVFSPDAGRLTYCNAGHEPGLLLRGDRFRRLEEGGMIIGVSESAGYEKIVLDLRPGDVLVLVTDGVTEALNFQDQPYGRQRLRASIRRYGHEDAPTLAKQILWDVRRFAGLAPQTDDLTVVVSKVS
ncbi:MAG: SpoIIE family protein phosphatase [Phycisphaerae bacterium]